MRSHLRDGMVPFPLPSLVLAVDHSSRMNMSQGHDLDTLALADRGPSKELSGR